MLTVKHDIFVLCCVMLLHQYTNGFLRGIQPHCLQSLDDPILRQRPLLAVLDTQVELQQVEGHFLGGVQKPVTWIDQSTWTAASGMCCDFPTRT